MSDGGERKLSNGGGETSDDAANAADAARRATSRPRRASGSEAAGRWAEQESPTCWETHKSSLPTDRSGEDAATPVVRRRTNTVPLPMVAIHSCDESAKGDQRDEKELSPVEEQKAQEHLQRDAHGAGKPTHAPRVRTYSLRAKHTQPHAQPHAAVSQQQLKQHAAASTGAGSLVISGGKAGSLHLVIPSSPPPPSSTTATLAVASPSSSTSSRDDSPHRPGTASSGDLSPLIAQLKPPIVLRKGPRGYGFTVSRKSSSTSSRDDSPHRTGTASSGDLSPLIAQLKPPIVLRKGPRGYGFTVSSRKSSSTSSRDDSPHRPGTASSGDLSPLIAQLKPPIVLRKGPRGYGFTVSRKFSSTSSRYDSPHRPGTASSGDLSPLIAHLKPPIVLRKGPRGYGFTVSNRKSSSASSRDDSLHRPGTASSRDLSPLIAPQLKPPIVLRKGPRGYGFTVRSVRVYLGKDSDYYTIQHVVSDVEPQSAAFDAGLTANDLITHMGGDPVQNLSHPQLMHKLLAFGDTLSLRVTPLEQTSIRTGTLGRKSAGKLARKKGYKQKLQRRALEKKRRSSILRRLSGKRASADLYGVGPMGGPLPRPTPVLPRSVSSQEGMLAAAQPVPPPGLPASAAHYHHRLSDASLSSYSSDTSSPAGSGPHSPGPPLWQSRPSSLRGLRNKLTQTARNLKSPRKHSQTMPLSPLARNVPASASTLASGPGATSGSSDLGQSSPPRAPSPLASFCVTGSSPGKPVKKTVTKPKKGAEHGAASTDLLRFALSPPTSAPADPRSNQPEGPN